VRRSARGYSDAMTTPATLLSQPLDPAICQQARLARDPRFDGEFFLAVTSTGIYCRPVCPARPPAERNVRYYQHAAQAAQDGFRPCLRCRPESAPGSPAWQGSNTTVQRALALIREGALNGEGSLAQLASRLGVGERYLRKLFQRELGLSPLAVAQNHRLHMAKLLLAETTLPVTEVALAAGFSSVRRFNSAIKAAFATTPGKLRRYASTASDTIELALHYRPPYDWNGVIDLLSRHAVPGVEHVTANCYSRNILIAGQPGRFTITPIAGKNALQLSLRLTTFAELMPLVARVRRMFDLDANPAVITASLGRSSKLGDLTSQRPGLRMPGFWSAEEATVRAIVGQQVSTAAARSICGRFAAACAADNTAQIFPRAHQIAALPDSQFPMPASRRDTLRRFAELQSGNSDDINLDALASLRGVGPWTTSIAAMRGLGQPDCFPTSDLGLIKAWEHLGYEKSALKVQSDSWRPWRSYAANLLWRSLTP
jgi:AraC family transcriptional regulator, regulatory protein of adaptative response / DNA-3-methyladenine glycosylase II